MSKQAILGRARAFKLGLVVGTTNYKMHGNPQEFGHVVGFSINPVNMHICIDVQFPTEKDNNYKVRSLHPDNLVIFE